MPFYVNANLNHWILQGVSQFVSEAIRQNLQLRVDIPAAFNDTVSAHDGESFTQGNFQQKIVSFGQKASSLSFLSSLSSSYSPLLSPSSAPSLHQFHLHYHRHCHHHLISTTTTTTTTIISIIIIIIIIIIIVNINIIITDILNSASRILQCWSYYLKIKSARHQHDTERTRNRAGL